MPSASGAGLAVSVEYIRAFGKGRYWLQEGHFRHSGTP
jgi:hypothetical protein